MIGEIQGVNEGAIFENRQALHDAGIHAGTQGGIGGGGESIVLSGGYVDDIDNGTEIIYTGQGGRDPNSGNQIADQELKRGNRQLMEHFIAGNPIRVSRGAQLDSPFAPDSGYRYDGLYLIDSAWHETGSDGYLVYRFRLVKISNSIPLAINAGAEIDGQLGSNDESAQRRLGTISRIIRNTKLASEIKAIYKYRCQISGVLLETPLGPYAEGCHIKPLGKPHNGPDSLRNILCLSPNMHILFDTGAIALTDDLALLGMEGTLRTHPDHQIDLEYVRYHRAHFFNG